MTSWSYSGRVPAADGDRNGGGRRTFLDDADSDAHDPPQIFLISGLGIIPIVVYAGLDSSPRPRFVFRLAAQSILFIGCVPMGLKTFPNEVPALLVANHVSWIDGVLILLASSRPIRMLAYADYFQGPVPEAAVQTVWDYSDPKRRWSSGTDPVAEYGIGSAAAGRAGLHFCRRSDFADWTAAEV